MSGLLSELRRRNVFRVAGVYTVVGWVLVQVAGALESGIGLPEWFDGFIIATLLIGFPLAMLLTWAFELTPEGVRPTPDAASHATGRGFALTDGAIIVGIAAVVCLATWQQLGAGGARSTAIATAEREPMPLDWPADDNAEIDAASIAVLPFADLSPDGDQEYFSDGIAEEILNVLARVDRLRVASRTSAFGFKGQEALGVPAIAEKLGVRHVLEGSVRKAGATVRITAQLIDAQTDTHLWSETFDRELTAENLFAIQDEIARAIVEQLGDILGEVTPSPASLDTATENLDAYEAYLQGRSIYYRRSAQNILEMVALFERAVTLDPEFAQAWASLSAAYAVVPGWNLGSEDEFVPKALESANRASALDDRLALPYSVRAAMNLDLGNIVSAIELLDAALERDAEGTEAHYIRGTLMLELGFFDAAIDDLRRCLEIDPGYEICRRFLSFGMLFAGKEQEAVRLFELGMLRGQYSWPYTFAGYYASTGNLSALAQLLAGDPRVGPVREALFRMYARTDFGVEAFRSEIRRLTGLAGYSLPPRLDPGAFEPQFYADLFWNPYSLYELRPDLLDGRTTEWRREWLKRRGIVDYWRTVEFPPQCRRVGDDDFTCEGFTD